MAKARRLDKNRFMMLQEFTDGSALLKKVNGLLVSLNAAYPLNVDGRSEASKEANEPVKVGSKMLFYPKGAIAERAKIERMIKAIGPALSAFGNNVHVVRAIPGTGAVAAAKAKKAKGRK